MSPTFKIDIGKELQKRVLNPDRPVKDFDDVIDLGMYNASKLGNIADLNFLKGMKKVELKLEENSEFKKMQHQMAMVRKQFVDSSFGKSMQKIAEMNKALIDTPHFKALIESQKQIREQALKFAIPSINIPDAFKRVYEITETHQKHYEEEDARIQLEVEKSELDMSIAEVHRITLSVKSKDAVYISDLYKQHEKNIQQHIDRLPTKEAIADGSGVSYKYRQKCLKVYKKYIQLQAQGKSKPVAKKMITNMKKFNKPTPKTLKTWLIQGKKESKNQPLLPSNK